MASEPFIILKRLHESTNILRITKDNNINITNMHA